MSYVFVCRDAACNVIFTHGAFGGCFHAARCVPTSSHKRCTQRLYIH